MVRRISLVYVVVEQEHEFRAGRFLEWRWQMNGVSVRLALGDGWVHDLPAAGVCASGDEKECD